MAPSELNERNYRRIVIINWLLSLPLLILFSCPYLLISRFLEIKTFFSYSGSVFFALPFMITILHGHVTLAIGSLHRHHFYRWLKQYPLSWGLFFHELLVSTRFRLSLLGVSLGLFLVGFATTG